MSTKTRERKARTTKTKRRRPQNHKKPSLDRLAREIKREHEAAESHMRDSLMHARRAGELLLEVKDKLEYGQWTEWVEAHCEFSHRTANLYMQLAREWETLEDSQCIANLTLGGAADLLRTLRAKQREGEKAATEDDWDYDEMGFYPKWVVTDAYKKLGKAADQFLDFGHEEYQHLRTITADRRHIGRQEVDRLLTILDGLRHRVVDAMDRLEFRKDQPFSTHGGPTLLGLLKSDDAEEGEAQET